MRRSERWTSASMLTTTALCGKCASTRRLPTNMCMPYEISAATFMPPTSLLTSTASALTTHQWTWQCVVVSFVVVVVNYVDNNNNTCVTRCWITATLSVIKLEKADNYKKKKKKNGKKRRKRWALKCKTTTKANKSDFMVALVWLVSVWPTAATTETRTV